MNQLICYCFEYTESDIRNDVFENNGKSLLMEEILDAKKRDGCNCASQNPKGT